jgi:hypothetical protein
MLSLLLLCWFLFYFSTVNTNWVSQNWTEFWHWPELAQTSQLWTQSHNTASHLETITGCYLCFWQTGYKSELSIIPFLGYSICWSFSHFTYYYVFNMKRCGFHIMHTGRNVRRAAELLCTEWGNGCRLFHAFSKCSMLHGISNQEALQIQPFWIFMEASLQSHK